MTSCWDHLQVEMMQAIVEQMDVRTRVNLSMCSKFENQLVRSSKRGKLQLMYIRRYGLKIFWEDDNTNKVFHGVIVRPTEDGGSKVYVNEHRIDTDKTMETYSTRDWKETIMNIMGTIGTKVKIEKLTLRPEIPRFKEIFKWIRNNIQLEPRRVSFFINSSDYGFYDESIFDWPSNTTIGFEYSGDKLPNLERFNTYDKIDWFSFEDLSYDGDQMTDEHLKKMRNVVWIKLIRTNVTLDGFHWWLKKWWDMKDYDDSKQYRFSILFKTRKSLENFTRTMSDVIGKSEPYFEGAAQCWKIKKNENVVGVIEWRDDYYLLFSSPVLNNNGGSVQVAENGNNNDGAVAQVAENGNINDRAVEQRAANGNDNDEAIEQASENEQRAENGSINDGAVEQAAENGSNNDEAIEPAAENDNLLINDEINEGQDVEMGTVPIRKKSFWITMCFLYLFTFFLPFALILIFCLIYHKINL